MPDAVIIDIVRTPGGRRNGALSGWHPVDPAAETPRPWRSATTGPALVDDVIAGVMQAGAQALNVGRNAVLAAGWPEEIPPPPSIAVRLVPAGRPLAAQGVMAGAHDAVVAAGVEVMSLVPMGPLIGSGVGFRSWRRVYDRWRDVELNAGQGPGGPGRVGRDHRQRGGLSRGPRRLRCLLPGAGRAGDRRGPLLENEIIPVVSKDPHEE